MKKEIVTVLFFLPFAFLIDRAQATMQSPLSCPTKICGTCGRKQINSIDRIPKD
jgi:hypothetical protein